MIGPSFHECCVDAPQSGIHQAHDRSGRYNNQSEVLRAALARLEDTEAAYLNPPPLLPKALARAYQVETPAEKALERKAVRASRVKPSMDT